MEGGVVPDLRNRSVGECLQPKGEGTVVHPATTTLGQNGTLTTSLAETPIRLTITFEGFLCLFTKAITFATLVKSPYGVSSGLNNTQRLVLNI